MKIINLLLFSIYSLEYIDPAVPSSKVKNNILLSLFTIFLAIVSQEVLLLAYFGCVYQ